MDVENLAKELILKNMTPEQQMAVLDSVRQSVSNAKEVQKKKIGENVDLVVQALKKIEADIRDRFDAVGNSIEKRVLSIQDGRDGANGKDGRDGKDGKSGRDGLKGDRGVDGQAGRDGVDGVDGISVVNAQIDFDGSLVITLSDGRELNVGEVVSQDIAEKIKVISTMSTNGAVGIKDEGTSISTGVKTINFVGAAVTATNSGDDVTVNVSAGTGTVTSVAATVPAFLSVSGSPITTTGTLAINLSGTALPIANGGTGNATGTATINANLTGDVTSVGNASTLATVNTNVGSFTNASLTVNGKGLITAASSGTAPVTSVTGTSPVVSSGGATPAISLAASYGDTQNPYASKTANFVLAAPDGTAGVPTFRAVVAADIPTLNQNTTGSAATLTTPRAIYGNNFDGSAALTQIIASTYGGTGNGFTKFSGATTAERTYTLPDASSTIVVQGGALGTPASGTVTNLTGTASININGTVGATTASTGAFTTLSATGVTTVQAGTALLPAIVSTTGTADTGIWFPAADTVAASTAGVERMRIDSSGNVGIGTSSPRASKLDVLSATGTQNTSADSPGLVNITGPNGANGSQPILVLATNDAMAANIGPAITFQARYLTSSTAVATLGYIQCIKENATSNNLQGALTFVPRNSAGNFVEAMRIDSNGNVMTGATSAAFASNTFKFSVTEGSSYTPMGINCNTPGTGSSNVFVFARNGTLAGAIAVTGTTTAYNTSSDYRLKENITPMTGALAKVSALKPVTYKWKLDDSDGEGFIAHELAEICPNAVNGQKDAVDADGNPVYQGIDVSFLVATLTAAIQELKALTDTQASTITALTARITALENK